MKDDLYEGLYDTNGKIANLDANKLKAALLERYSKNPTFYENEIKNIDNITNELMLYGEMIKEQQEKGNSGPQISIKDIMKDEIKRDSSDGDVVPYDFRLYPHKHSWYIYPYVYDTDYCVTYSQTWIGIDNYRSSVPVTYSTTTKRSVSVTLGFSGASFIKDTLGLSGSFSDTQETVISQGATCPAWTAWYRRPYIRWYTDYWYGEEQFEYYDIGQGAWVTTWEDRYGQNKVEMLKAEEYWSITNYSHNPSASTPLPPSGSPA